MEGSRARIPSPWSAFGALTSRESAGGLSPDPDFVAFSGFRGISEGSGTQSPKPLRALESLGGRKSSGTQSSFSKVFLSAKLISPQSFSIRKVFLSAKLISPQSFSIRKVYLSAKLLTTAWKTILFSI